MKSKLPKFGHVENAKFCHTFSFQPLSHVDFIYFSNYDNVPSQINELFSVVVFYFKPASKFINKLKLFALRTDDFQRTPHTFGFALKKLLKHFQRLSWEVYSVVWKSSFLPCAPCSFLLFFGCSLVFFIGSMVLSRAFLHPLKGRVETTHHQGSNHSTSWSFKVEPRTIKVIQGDWKFVSLAKRDQQVKDKWEVASRIPVFQVKCHIRSQVMGTCSL